MHNTILEYAFPPALGTGHLSMQEKCYYQKTSITGIFNQLNQPVMMNTTNQTKIEQGEKKSASLPCQIELKPNVAAYSAPLLGPHHPDPHHHHHLHSAAHHHHHHHQQHHFDWQQLGYLPVDLRSGKEKQKTNTFDCHKHTQQIYQIRKRHILHKLTIGSWCVCYVVIFIGNSLIIVYLQQKNQRQKN